MKGPVSLGGLILAALLNAVLMPLFFGLAYFAIQHFRGSRPDLLYIRADRDYIVIPPPPSIAKRILNDSGLISEFPDLIRQATPSSEDPNTCVDWLDEGAWNSDCLQIYKTVSDQFEGITEAAILQGHGSVEETNARKSLATIREFKRAIGKIERSTPQRAGSVRITAGVLNVGDSDGTVLAQAELSFNGKAMHVTADQYTFLRAHDFAEVVFSTPREEEDGSISGSYSDGEETTVKEWLNLVRAGGEIPYVLTVTLGDKKDKIKGTVPSD